MGFGCKSFWRTAGVLGFLGLALMAGGCQFSRPVSNYRLIEHQALVDFSGLDSTMRREPLKVICAVPRGWEGLPLQKTPLLAHQQWRSPSAATGVGVAYVHLPFPLSTDAVIWLAKQKYAQRKGDGQMIAEWNDGLGRHWFEAEDRRFHVRGYAVVEGFSAWFVYFGYRINRPLHPGEISVACRALETVVPNMAERLPGTVTVTAEAAKEGEDGRLRMAD
jgi:hypothetical protein